MVITIGQVNIANFKMKVRLMYPHLNVVESDYLEGYVINFYLGELIYPNLRLSIISSGEVRTYFELHKDDVLIKLLESYK